MMLNHLFRKKDIVNRDDVHLLIRHSDITDLQVSDTLHDEVYAQKAHWSSFTQLLLMMLGIGLFVAGVIFFFAFNWHGLHKYLKFGIIMGLIIAFVYSAYYWRVHTLLSHCLLTGAVMSIGALWAVFGQVYQTGANAYSFFGAWLCFAMAIALVTKFEPLWLIVVGLVNATVGFYLNEVDLSLTSGSTFSLLMGINVLMWLVMALIRHSGKVNVASWFLDVLFLLVCFLTTIGICTCIFSNDAALWINIIIGLVVAGLGSTVAFREKRIYNLGLIALSSVIILTCALIDFSYEEFNIFFISLFIIASVSLASYLLITLDKQWHVSIFK